MKFQLSPETVPGEFVGHSAREAVERAKIALGADAPVRCWKTRRGGVLGFFAHEIFVAGLHEPRGNVVTGSRTGAQVSSLTSPEPSATPVALEELIAATSDEVTLEYRTSEREFRDVLAQAESALRDVGEDPSWDHREPDVAPSPRISAPSEDVEEFRTSLASLGLTAWYQPLPHEGALDGLARSLGNLPPAPPMPTAPGSLIAVLGSRRDAGAVAHEVATYLALDESDVIALTDEDALRRRIVRRRNSTRVSVVIIVAPTSARDVHAAKERLSRVSPEYVLGAVPATLKYSDGDRWCRELGVDALALRRWDDTETPAELVAARPVLSVDGVMMSRLRWVTLLLATYLERHETE